LSACLQKSDVIKQLLSVQDTREQQLQLFEKKVTQLQCFTNIFCSPIFVDTGKLPGELIHIRKDWNDLILYEVQHQFDDLPIIPHLEWLYELRGSELFLIQWKLLGNSEHLKELLQSSIGVLQKITSISIEKSQYVTENLFQVMLTHVPVPTIPIPPPPPGAQAVIPAPPPPPPPGIVVGPPLPPPFPTSVQFLFHN